MDDEGAERGSPLEREAEFLERLARSLARDDPEYARDLAQDTWLAAVMRRLWTSRLRGRPRRRTSEIDEEALPGAPGTDEIAREEIAGILRRSVGALPEPYRTVVHMRFFEGLEPREIAAVLGRPRATVFTQINRG